MLTYYRNKTKEYEPDHNPNIVEDVNKIKEELKKSKSIKDEDK